MYCAQYNNLYQGPDDLSQCCRSLLWKHLQFGAHFSYWYHKVPWDSPHKKLAVEQVLVGCFWGLDILRGDTWPSTSSLGVEAALFEGFSCLQELWEKLPTYIVSQFTTHVRSARKIDQMPITELVILDNQKLLWSGLKISLEDQFGEPLRTERISNIFTMWSSWFTDYTTVSCVNNQIKQLPCQRTISVFMEDWNSRRRIEYSLGGLGRLALHAECTL